MSRVSRSGSRIPRTVAAEVTARAGGCCEACTHPLVYLGFEHPVFHHRLLRSQGGTDSTANLMLVHDKCHNLNSWSIHGRPARSVRLGHIVRRGVDPATVPVIPEPKLRSVLL